MKKIFKILLVAMLIGGGIVTENRAKAQSVNVSLSVFQNSLSPYGRWVNNNRYGQVWIANERNFTPYETGGHWAYTDYGWTWVSDYDWGWAPFHYGRWDYEPNTGWFWVPGYDWGPAWVAWRNGGDYYGWAPLSPGLDISVGVSFGNRIPSGRWVFAPSRYITSPYVNRYYVPRTRNVTIIKNTTIVNNVTVKNNVHIDAGPRRDEVERVTHTKVKTYTVANSSKPGKTVINNNTVNVYRPVVNKTTVNNNNKTVVNKNSNNKTVNKNNNTTVDKNSNNTTVNKNKTTVKNDKKTTVNKTNNNTTVKKDNNNKTVENNKIVNKDVQKAPQHKEVKKAPQNKEVKQAPQNNNATVNKKINSSNKQTTLKKNAPVKSKPDVKSANKNKPEVKKQTPQTKKNAPDSNNRKNGKKK